MWGVAKPGPMDEGELQPARPPRVGWGELESASGGSETWEMGDPRDAAGAGLGGATLGEHRALARLLRVGWGGTAFGKSLCGARERLGQSPAGQGGSSPRGVTVE